MAIRLMFKDYLFDHDDNAMGCLWRATHAYRGKNAEFYKGTDTCDTS